ncbi:MAG: DUF1583 domain-containing protein [Planctomyces sp.]|nr:DUF1583 domain-containing protein [Planctomyces sp.]
MRFHLAASIGLPRHMTRIEFSRLTVLTLLLLTSTGDRIFSDEVRTSAVAALFAADEAILSENTDLILRRASALPLDRRFDVLADWLLPSTERSAIRMKATFAQTDPPPIAEPVATGSTIEGIRTPVFLLIQVAQETNRLDELRRRVASINGSLAPHEVRAKLAMLYMIDSAGGDSEAAAESLTALSALVRTRGENLDGRWWPETLALAFGMQDVAKHNEMLDLATSIYDPQIGHSIWSGHVEWDLFVATSFAKLRPGEKQTNKISSMNESGLEGWIPASAFTAESRGRGHSDSNWQWHGNTVSKVGGHNGDLLYLPVPLTGNFEILCDVTSFDYRETAIAYGGRYVQHHWTRKDVEVGTTRDFVTVPLATRMTEPDAWLSSRIKVQDGVVTYYLNGRQTLQRTLPDGYSPWLALRAFRLSRGSIRNLAVAGQPVVPGTLDLSSSSDLDGWFAYFDEPVGDPNNSASWQPNASNSGPSEIRHQRQTELADTMAESLLVYHRPIREEGVIEYDFFYDPNRSVVHPALDRMVFLLTPDGVRTHWVTDGKWQQDDINPGNVSRERLTEETGLLPNLLPNAWNHIKLSIQADKAQLKLNDTMLCRINIPESSNRQFGLFHYSGESDVRVRNVRWSANWQIQADSPLFPKPQQVDVAEIEQATAALPNTYSQTLSGLTRFGDYLIKRGGSALFTDEGAALQSVSTGTWLETRLPLWLNVSGDFDIQASFSNFEHSAEGEAGLKMMTTLDSSLQRIELARNAGSDQQQKLKTQISVLKPNDQRDYFDRWIACDVAHGTLRIVRLGTKLHYLIAENDSTIFRLLGTNDVATDDLRLGDLCLAVYSDRNGTSKVTWTKVLVRGTRLFGEAIPDLRMQASQLDERRKSMQLVLSHDFTRQAPDATMFYRWTDVRPWSEADGGLKLNSVGADNWQSAGISTQIPVIGDFDMRVEFDSLNLAVPGAGHQSGLHFQIDPVAGNQIELNSMIGVGPSGMLEAEGYMRSKLPNGTDEYRGTERHIVPSATALRLVRQGKRYMMLVRSSDESQDRIVSMTETTNTPIRTTRFTLHTGGSGRESSVRLKRFEVYSAP